mgnify:CR=1 FL=1
MTLPFDNDTSAAIQRIASAHLKHDKFEEGPVCFCDCIGNISYDCGITLSFRD